jgi:hypothetical protein
LAPRKVGLSLLALAAAGAPAWAQRPPVPPTGLAAERAAVRQAADALSLEENELATLRSLLQVPLARWGDGEAKLAEAVVGPRRDLLRRFGRLAAGGAGRWDLDPEEDAARGLAFLAAARLLAVEARLDVFRRDHLVSLHAGRQIADLARALYREDGILWAMLGSAVEHQHLRFVHEFVELPEVPAAALARLVADLGAAPPIPSVAEVLRGERAYFRRQAEMDGGDTARQRPATEEMFEDLIAAAELPYQGFLEAHEAVMDERRDDPKAVLATLLFPNFLETIRRVKGIEAAGRLAVVAARLRSWAAERGSYPETLAAAGENDEDATYAGDVWAYAVTPEGAALLSSPAALALERQHPPARGALGLEELFTWELPPPRREGSVVSPPYPRPRPTEGRSPRPGP